MKHLLHWDFFVVKHLELQFLYERCAHKGQRSAGPSRANLNFSALSTSMRSRHNTLHTQLWKRNMQCNIIIMWMCLMSFMVELRHVTLSGSMTWMLPPTVEEAGSRVKLEHGSTSLTLAKEDYGWKPSLRLLFFIMPAFVPQPSVSFYKVLDFWRLGTNLVTGVQQRIVGPPHRWLQTRMTKQPHILGGKYMSK